MKAPNVWKALLSVPLFYKILIANAMIVVVGIVLGTALTLHYVRTVPTPVLIAGLALGGVGLTLTVNALILMLALTPLKLLETTAARIQGGDLDARVPYSALADRQLERLMRTFNGMLDALELNGQRLREVAARALNAEEEERKRISRELHDDTAQTLAALLIRLRVARSSDEDATRNAQLEEFRLELGEAIERIRRYARGLRPPALDELGLTPALESHVRSIEESTDIPISFEMEPLDRRLTPQAELVLYRIAQEALANATRHAGATRVSLRLREEMGAVVLTVSDDGSGFDVGRVRSEGRGLGLFGMEERALYVGGEVEIRSAPGGGTQLRATIPIRGARTQTPL